MNTSIEGSYKPVKNKKTGPKIKNNTTINNKPIKRKLKPFKGNQVLKPIEPGIDDKTACNGLERDNTGRLTDTMGATEKSTAVIGGAQPTEIKPFKIPSKLDFTKLANREDYKIEPEKVISALHIYASTPGSFNKACTAAGIDQRKIFAAMIDDPQWESLYIQALKSHSHIFVQEIDDIVSNDKDDLIVTQRETSDGRAFSQITVNNARVKRDDIRSKMYLSLAERLNSTLYSPLVRADTRNFNVNANIDVPSSDLASIPVMDMLRGQRNNPGSV